MEKCQLLLESRQNQMYLLFLHYLITMNAMQNQDFMEGLHFGPSDKQRMDPSDILFYPELLQHFSI